MDERTRGAPCGPQHHTRAQSRPVGAPRDVTAEPALTQWERGCWKHFFFFLEKGWFEVEK